MQKPSIYMRICDCFFVFFFKKKTAYELRISDWSSDVCSSDLPVHMLVAPGPRPAELAVDVVSSVQALVGAWPVDVRRIALVGHGSGGLVLRAAVAVEAFGGESWLDLVSDMVLLGTPHLAVPASGPNLSPRAEAEGGGIATAEDRRS